jgi:hypothetical protein
MDNAKLNRRATSVIIVLISILSGVVVLYSTVRGPWVRSDSVEYLQAAENLLLGKGITIHQASGEYIPLSLHPPFYPASLALFKLISGDMLAGARWLGAIMLCATSMLLGFSVLELLGDNLAAILICLLFASSPTILHVHSGAMSESPFFFTSLAGVFLIILYIRDSRRLHLVAAAIFLSAALLSRYVAVSAIFATVLLVVLFGHSDIKRRIGEAVFLIIIVSAPLLIWRISLAISLPDAPALAGSLSLSRIWSVLEPVRGSVTNEIWDWTAFSILPVQLQYQQKLIFFILAALALLALTIMVAKQARAREPQSWYRSPEFTLLIASVAYIAAYIIFFSLSFLLLNLQLNLNARLFSPLWLAFLLAFLSGYCFIVKGRGRKPYFHVALLIGASLFLIPNIVKTPGIVDHLHHEGEGLTSQTWQNSDLIREVRTMPSSVPIISNETAAILFLVGRPAYDMEEVISPVIYDQSSQFGESPTEPARAILRDNGGALVLFDSIYWQLWPKYGSGTQDRLDDLVSGLHLQTMTDDGGIYFYTR